MVLREKRERAAQLGLTLAEAEEQDLLQQAVESSRAEGGDEAGADDDDDAPRGGIRGISSSVVKGSVMGSVKGCDSDEEDSDDDEEFEYGDEGGGVVVAGSAGAGSGGAGSGGSLPERDREESIWEGLPVDATLLVHSFIGDVDMLGYIACVSRQRYVDKSLSPSPMEKQGLCLLNEQVYRHYCRQIFLHQYPDRKLNLSKFRSYKSMLIHRPRLRTNGFYTLKTLHTRAPCNDNFWEERKTKSIEVAWNRHMRFYDGGLLLYSLSTAEAFEGPLGGIGGGGMGSVGVMRPVPKKIFVGSFSSKGREVSVRVPMHYCTIMFTLTVLDGSESYSKYGGKHSVLRIDTHSQVGRDGSLYDIRLPANCDMRFHRMDYLSPAHNQDLLPHADADVLL